MTGGQFDEDAVKLLFSAIIPFARQAWVADALCAQVGPDPWFPTLGGNTIPARKICKRCTAELECAQWALANPNEKGVWGAMSEETRESVRAQQRARLEDAA